MSGPGAVAAGHSDWGSLGHHESRLKLPPCFEVNSSIFQKAEPNTKLQHEYLQNVTNST